MSVVRHFTVEEANALLLVMNHGRDARVVGRAVERDDGRCCPGQPRDRIIPPRAADKHQSLDAARDRVSQQQAQIGALQSHLTEVTSNAPRQVQTRKASVIVRKAALDLAKRQSDPTGDFPAGERLVDVRQHDGAGLQDHGIRAGGR